MIDKSTRANAPKSIFSLAAFALKASVSKVTAFPVSAKNVLLFIRFSLNRISIKFSLLNLKRCKLRLAPRFKVLSAFIVKGLPFSKSVFSSTLKGFTRTPNFKISDVSFLFCASFTNAQPMDAVPKSKPNIFFIFQMYYKIF